MSNKRVPATDRVRAEIDELFADVGRDLAEVLEEVARLGVRLLIQSALEAEVTAFLGREPYERNPDAGPGYRNGYAPTSVKTTAGKIDLKRPKVTGSLEAFSSRLLGKHVTRTNALEALVICGWVRGLSTRDIEAALEEALGPDASISESTVSRICEQIKDEVEVWQDRDLSDVTTLRALPCHAGSAIMTLRRHGTALRCLITDWHDERGIEPRVYGNARKSRPDAPVRAQRPRSVHTSLEQSAVNHEVYASGIE